LPDNPIHPQMRTSFLLIVSLLQASVPVCWSQTFASRHDAPGAVRDGAISFAIDGKVYMGGGLGSKDFFEYDPVTNAWTPKENIPNCTTERAFATGFAIGNKGYVCLGSDGSVFKSDLWEYDPPTNHWTQRASYPSTAPRNAAFAFVINDQAFVCGGVDNDFIYSDFFMYDQPNNSWTPLGAIPNGPTCFGSTFTINGYGYVFGGDHGISESDEVWRYDPTGGGSWEQMNSSPVVIRQTAVSFVLGGIGYFGLGQTQYETPFDDMFSYDPVGDEWTPIGLFPGGVRCWATGTSTGDRAFVGTGWNFSTTFFKDWWEFTPAVGIGEVGGTNTLSLYPNPATDALNIRFTGHGKSQVQVVDDTGKVVRSATTIDGYLHMDVASLANGPYELIIRPPGLTPTHGRFVKR
jgi:N-acetylneuraminic acid mutarotase